MKVLFSILLLSLSALAIYANQPGATMQKTNKTPKVLQRYEILVSPKVIVKKVKAPKELTILFPIDGYILNPDTKRRLAMLTSAPGSEIKIDGHADGSGWEDFNKKLSLLRAQSVKQAIIDGSSVTNLRCIVTGWGASRPIGDNRTIGGRAANRRVVVRYMEED